MFKFFNKNKGGAVEWIVVFLGNPGPKYENTRHNAGFMAADACERDLGVSITRSRFKALTAQTKLDGHGVLLLKPQTFMNLSGEAAGQAASFYKVPAERVIVVSDDVSLPAGRLRVRAKGSAGGHNGIKNLISCLGTDAFPRVKIGVGSPAHPGHDMIDWVTGRFDAAEAGVMHRAAGRAWQAVRCYILEGAEKAMNSFNSQ
ncbi:MAG: aminoacyl-tRNA hydrolase [Butyricicoccus sp.]|nr:aminoacyl-tRNA hydrolase [Butyricicoccus sp.]